MPYWFISAELNLIINILIALVGLIDFKDLIGLFDLVDLDRLGFNYYSR